MAFDEQELLAVAVRAAEVGGAELLARFRQPVEIQTKSTPTDPVSAADLASEAAIRQVIGEARPDDAILGEEGGETYGDGRAADGVFANGGLRWVVDPLDGTVNYLYGIARFCVSIAVEDGVGAIAGVVLDPVTGERFLATRSGPALRFATADAEGEALHGSACETLSQALIATGFSYASDVRAVQGRIVTRLLGRVRDIAAGTLICERAGLVVRHLPVIPAGGSDPEIGDGIMVARPAFAQELYELVA
jgi:myo-inositol-1(or 4)-monophosphatase